MRTAKTDQTGRMPRLNRICAGRTTTLLVFSRRGSFVSPNFLIFFFLFFLMFYFYSDKQTGSEKKLPFSLKNMMDNHGDLRLKLKVYELSC